MAYRFSHGLRINFILTFWPQRSKQVNNLHVKGICSCLNVLRQAVKLCMSLEEFFKLSPALGDENQLCP